jgi:hypothetical protein
VSLAEMRHDLVTGWLDVSYSEMRHDLVADVIGWLEPP